jgi:hypothetical protein
MVILKFGFCKMYGFLRLETTMTKRGKNIEVLQWNKQEDTCVYKFL